MSAPASHWASAPAPSSAPRRWPRRRRSPVGRWPARRVRSGRRSRPTTSSGPGRCCRRWSAATRAPSGPVRSPGPSWSPSPRTRWTRWPRPPSGGRWPAPGALGYRAANTLDSMVGHRSVRYANFGWASARLDDPVAWVPARLTALLVAVVRPQAARAVRRGAAPGPGASLAERRRGGGRVRRRARGTARGEVHLRRPGGGAPGPGNGAGPPASTTSAPRSGSRAT